MRIEFELAGAEYTHFKRFQLEMKGVITTIKVTTASYHPKMRNAALSNLTPPHPPPHTLAAHTEAQECVVGVMQAWHIWL